MRATANEPPAPAKLPVTPPVIFGMHNRYGRLARWVFDRVFGPIHFPARCADQLGQISKQGAVIYVTRGRTNWLALYFNHALTRLGLPLAAFVGGVSLLVWQPLGTLWRGFRHRGHTPRGPWESHFDDRPPTRAEAQCMDTALRGKPVFLVLRQRGFRGLSRVERDDFFRALVVAQRCTDKPIFVVPHILADRMQSGAAIRSLTDRIFGDRRRPGMLRQIWMFLTTLRSATVRTADPINLKELDQENPQADEQLLARKLSHELNRRMDDEERVIAGGELFDTETTIRHVMRNPLVQEAVDSEAKRTSRKVSSLESKAEQDLSNIAARYNVRYIIFLSWVLNGVFDRIYDGIAVDEAGLARIIEAARKGPIIFCPSHRSHIDYLVLSYVLWQRGVAPPHIAAGANLSFFPLGTIFRGCGAFFLRRSFRDDAIYSAVFRGYVEELVRSGTALEFFLEGTRSRTGKHLMPKFGVLSMVVDAWRRGAQGDIQFVPVSIDYERIIEARSYEKELMGAEKKREDLGGLLRSTKVLRSRYGRVAVQFGEAISLKEVADSRELPQNIEPEHDNQWRHTVERLGYRVLHEVAMACTVTATAVVATALLSHHARGLAEGDLLELCQGIVDFLESVGARLSPALQNPGSRESAVHEAVQNLVDQSLVAVSRPGRSDAEPIYRVPEERRILLDFHKNALMNYFAPAAEVACAILRHGEQSGMVSYDEVREDTRFLSRLFKKEFIYRSDSDFETYFDEVLAILAVRGIIDVPDDGTIRIRDRLPLRLLGGLLDSFLEGYWVTATTLRDLRSFPLWQKELLTRSIERTRRAFLESEISRPEAANRTLIESAVAWMQGEGVVVTTTERSRQSVKLAPHYTGDELELLINKIASLIGPGAERRHRKS